MKTTQEIAAIIAALKELYPDAACSLDYGKDYELLFSVRLAAHLILGDIYGQEGYVCDTHCIRITGRLGITDGSKDPLKVEQQLRKVIPPEESNNFCHRMVLHGRALCMARGPLCSECPLQSLCDYGKEQ